MGRNSTRKLRISPMKPQSRPYRSAHSASSNAYRMPHHVTRLTVTLTCRPTTNSNHKRPNCTNGTQTAPRGRLGLPWVPEASGPSTRATRWTSEGSPHQTSTKHRGTAERELSRARRRSYIRGSEVGDRCKPSLRAFKTKTIGRRAAAAADVPTAEAGLAPWRDRMS